MTKVYIWTPSSAKPAPMTHTSVNVENEPRSKKTHSNEADEKHPPRQALAPLPEAIQEQACKQRELGQCTRDEQRAHRDHELVRVQQDSDR